MMAANDTTSGRDDVERASDPFDRLGPLRERACIGYDALVDATAEPIDWIWDGVIARDHAVEIAGPSGVGKTTLTFLLIAAVANPTGKPVKLLGREVQPGPPGEYVVVIEEENGTHSTRRLAERSCELLGLPVRETLNRVVFLVRSGARAHEADPALRGSTVWSCVAELGQRGHVALVVIDSRARVLRNGETRDEDAQAEVAEVLHEMIEACGSPCVVVSHTRKSGADSIEDIGGSNQRGAGADAVLLVTADRDPSGKVRSTRVKFAKLRDAPDEYPEPANFSIARDEDGAWQLAVDASAAPEDQPAHERVFALLRREGEKSKSDLRSSLKVSGTTLEQALSVLFAEKRIRKTKKTVRGRPADVFAAKTSPREVGELMRRGAEDESAASGADGAKGEGDGLDDYP